MLPLYYLQGNFMRIWFLIGILLLAVACSDDTQSVASNNDGPTEPRPDLGDGNDVGEKANGENCSANSECTSGICEQAFCTDAATGPRCGSVYCASPDECLRPGVCGIDELPQCGPDEEIVDGECRITCAETRCDTPDGEICCASGTGCLFEKCVDLGDTCDEENTCPFTQFCEPTLGRCIDLDEDPNACIFSPPVGDFDPVEAYSWSGSTVAPTYDQVMMMPVVANLTDDNQDNAIDADDVPDILFTTFAGNAYTGDGVLRLIDGATGTEHWASTEFSTPIYTYGSAIPAVGDIDLDGFPDIVVQAGSAGGLYALEHNGDIKWKADIPASLAHGGPAIANVDGSGNPEILTASALLNSNGQRICDFAERTLVPTLADLDMDGTQEIILGSAIYKLEDPTATDGTGCSGYSMGAAGWTAVANFDDDPFPEIVVVEDGALVLLEHDGTEIWRQDLPIDAARINALFNIPDCSPTTACVTNAECAGGRCFRGQCVPDKACLPGGGPPTIADFDGDRQPEIGIAGRWFYLVYESDGSIVWAHQTKDFSSAVTGSSVFDFEGDGRAEVVYNDEEFLRVYSGLGSGADTNGDGFDDPEILLEIQNSSGTLMEYPLIVDVDADGSAEIVVMANNYSTAGSTTKGIRVLKDSSNKWVGTRPIWNQHSYHVTNVNDDGSIPFQEQNNWEVPWLNNYRQNVQGANPLNAPNFTPVLDELDGTSCASRGLIVKFTVTNQGSIGVRAGALDTTIFAAESGQQLMPVGSVTNTIPLGPGASESFEFVLVSTGLEGKNVDVKVITDYAIDGSMRHNECKEDDNESAVLSDLCDVPG